MLATEPRWTYPAHLKLLDDLLVRVEAGELKRLIVPAAVRHGKSEMCSRFFPAHHIGMFPDSRMVVAGYGAEFAAEWGAKARDILMEHGQRFFGVRVDRTSHAKHRWTLDASAGSMYSLGVGSPLTGRGADVLVIDDPFKNAEEADSELLRDKIWDWYFSTARTRLEPGGAVVIVMARWHEDDLVGRLLNHPDDVEPWTVVNMPALAEENDQLGREPGEPLWPERYGREELEAIRKTMPPRWWNALYQQRPSAAEGSMFKRSNFRYWREETEYIGQHGVNPRTWLILADGEETRRFDTGQLVRFQTVDVAISGKETADWTVVATWVATPQGDLVLTDVKRRHFEEQETVEFLAAANIEHGRPPMWVERFGAGRNPLAILATRGHPVMEIPVEAGTKLDKVTRAFGAAALYEQHKVFHPHGQPAWLGAFEDELAAFWLAKHDDQVDTVAYAARLLPSMGVGARRREPVEFERPVMAGIMSERF